jgi:type I site-specific restriction endonuclease
MRPSRGKIWSRKSVSSDLALPGRFFTAARDFPLAVVEAKASYKHAADGLQQSKNYAEMLGLKFAYATSGHEIIEFDYITGVERACEKLPNTDLETPRQHQRLIDLSGGIASLTHSPNEAKTERFTTACSRKPWRSISAWCSCGRR